MKAFIVDDDPITLTLVAFMLNEEGVETQYCLSPVQDNLCRNIEEFHPDVIILDIYLENESGFEVAKNIRQSVKLKDTPIVAISGSHSVEDKLQAFITGFIDYIPKPFTKDEILQTVRKYGYSSEILRLCERIHQREELDRELYFKFDKE